MAIQQISKGDVHNITSGQVVIDLLTAVKELVENALDAGSTQVTVIFRNYGLDSIEVVDNGSGIEESDFEKICLKHYTSKLSAFDDIATIGTLGFRGEALSSLCAMADVIITTGTKKTRPKAHKLVYSHSGALQETSVASGSVGTSIRISNLFHNLPVRRIDLTKNGKREFQKALNFLQSYAIINVGVRFIVQHIDSRNKKTILMSSTGARQMKNNILSVFGPNGMFGLESVDFTLNISSRFKMKNCVMDLRFSGFLSNCSFGRGRASSDRQLWFVNNRPVKLTQLSKAITEVYKSYNHLQSPVIILNIEIDTEFVDVNVTPDKTTVFLHNETLIIECLKEQLKEIFDAQDTKIPVNHSADVSLSRQRRSGPRQSLLETFKREESDEGEKRGSDGERDGEKSVEEQSEEEQSEKEGEEEGEEEEVMSEEVDLDNILPEEANDHTPNVKKEKVNEVIEEEEEEKEEEEEEEEEEKAVEEQHDILQLTPSDPIEQPLIESSNIIANSVFEPPERSENTQTFEDIEGSNNSLRQRIQEEQNQLDLFPPIYNTEETCKTAIDPININESENTTYNEACCSHAHSPRAMSTQLQDEPPNSFSFVPPQRTKDNIMTVSVGETVIESRVVGNRRQIKFEDSTQETKPITDTSPRGLTKRRVSQLEWSTHNVRMCLDLNETDLRLKKRKPAEPSARYGRRKPKREIDDIADGDEAEKKLALTVAKSDFLAMKVIGQFNLGFIIVVRTNKDTGESNLFIIDQHASDEKYNFERLQEETTFNNQPLVVPQRLELNVIDELTMMNSVEVFEKNGFRLAIDEDLRPGERVRLLSLPYSKDTTFSLSDLHELIHLVKENDGKGAIRPSKVRAMFAMRACRSSIMIGKPLAMKTMQQVVRNLSTLDKPWNCPHGRPTMRHLAQLRDWACFEEDYTV